MGEGREVIGVDPKYFRPTEVEVLIADAGKSEKHLNWKPSVKFAELVKIMVDADLKAAGLDPIGKGDAIIDAKFPHRWWKGD